MDGVRFDNLLDYAASPLFFDMFLHAEASRVWAPAANPSPAVLPMLRSSAPKRSTPPVTELIDERIRSCFLNRAPIGFDFPTRIVAVTPYRVDSTLGQRTVSELQVEWQQNGQDHRETGPSNIHFTEYSEVLTRCIATEVLHVVGKTGKGMYADWFDEEQFVIERMRSNHPTLIFTISTVRCRSVEFDWIQHGRNHRENGPQRVSLENLCVTSLNGKVLRYWYDKLNYKWQTAANRVIPERLVKELNKQLDIMLDLLSVNSVFRNHSDQMTFFSELIEVDSGRGSPW